jgi:putative glutathione S-transferase
VSATRTAEPTSTDGYAGAYGDVETFERDTEYVTDRIVADPVTAEPKKGGELWPVEAGRYRLAVARACPWANRAVIVRRLLGLEGALSMGIAGPTHDETSWKFDLDPGERDPVLGIHKLREAYEARFPDYPKGITVPAIVEVETGRLVTNDFWSITTDLCLEWTAHHREGAPDLYPEEHRDEIEAISTEVYHDVNNGVYKSGFAGSQQAYERAYDELFARLDQLSERLRDRRYLVGDSITLADVRLWVTLARFDMVYHNHFRTNRHKLTELPVLWAYARDLWQTPGFGDTIDPEQVKDHYYICHRDLNPKGIVPRGPALDGWLTPHGREELGGTPFRDGTPPGPPPEAERIDPGSNPTLDERGMVRTTNDDTRSGT